MPVRPTRILVAVSSSPNQPLSDGILRTEIEKGEIPTESEVLLQIYQADYQCLTNDHNAPFVNVKRTTFEHILQNFTNVRITVEQFTNSVCFEIGRGDLAPGRMVTVITQSGGAAQCSPGQGEVTITASDSHRSKLAGLVVFGGNKL